MSYFEDNGGQYGRKPRLIPYLAMALIFSILGGITSLALAPKLLNWPQNQGGYQQPINLPPLTEEDSRVVAVAKTVGPAVVGISNQVQRRTYFRQNFEEQGSGSGVIIDAAGYIATNNHVVENASKLIVSLFDGRQAEAVLVGRDPRTDLAVLKIDLPNLPVAKLGDSTKLQVGELAIAIGNPGGKEFFGSVTSGIISGLNRQLTSPEGYTYTFNLIQTDAAINPGNSGGALVNGQGEVVGINSIKIALEGFEGMGFAIPMDYAQQIINEIIQNKRVIRPALGVFLMGEIIPEVNRQYQLGVDYGVAIQPSPEGGAMKAGLKDGDIIVAVDGQQVKDFSGLQKIIFAHKIGDTVKVTVMREGQSMDFDVVLGELPE